VKFGVFVEKIFFLNKNLLYFDPLALKIENFGQNCLQELENWLLAYFCMGNLKKLVLRRSADPQIPARDVYADIVS
jgi:hypothetical protein